MNFANIGRMKTFTALAILLCSMILSRAEMKTAIPLWPGGAPGALGHSTNDIPTLTPYLPDLTNATGAAMVICPGGAYAHLAPHEGNDYALWLNQHGVTCFVLKYRLGSSGYHYPAEFQDAARAVRWVRAHADDYRIDPKRVGIMGSSAGGHLASMLLTHFDSGDANSPDEIERQSSRPDIGILCYPVITMGEFAHQGSKDNLLGKNPSPELVKELSSELQATTNTPPCFIWQAFEDKTVSVENSLLFAEALRKNHVPFDLHIYQKGKHGQGLGDKPPFEHPLPWADECLSWLELQSFVKNQARPF
jgi:acetyl esterase/lipase